MDTRQVFFRFTFHVIFTFTFVASRPNQGNVVCDWAAFEPGCSSSCVSVDECARRQRQRQRQRQGRNATDNGEAVACGGPETGTAKVCCSECSPPRPLRSRRQSPPTWSTRAPVAAKKDSALIVQRKCAEYSAFRYVYKQKQSLLIGKRAEKYRVLDCIRAEPLIHEGKLAKLKEFPHMALIGYNDRSDRVEHANWDCGGSLISERFVLSAAHCVKGGHGDAKWVRLGELILDNDNDKADPKDFRIVERIAHPRYTTAAAYYDVALFRLHAAVQFTPHVRPICLFTAGKIPANVVSKALITGWGVTDTGEANSEALLKATVDVVDDNECRKNYNDDKKLRNGYDSASMICAADKINGSNTCHGDSGGPLQIPIPDWQCMYYQVGVTSYGDFFCGNSEKSSVYTKVSNFVPWIQSIVWP